MLTACHLKEKIKQNKPVIGTWSTLASPLASEALACAGLDFLIIDFEHGPFQLDKVHEYVSRCEIHDCSPIVRIPSNLDWMALQALDQGAHGIMVPHVDSAENARHLKTIAKYQPLGSRGFTPFSKAGGFSNFQAKKYSEIANDLTITAVIIESKEALDNLDEILSADNVDIVYFGAYDLSHALGVPGEIRHQKVLKAIQNGIRSARQSGKYSGAFVAETRDDIKWLIDMGCQFITYSVDSFLIYKPMFELVQWFSKEIRS